MSRQILFSSLVVGCVAVAGAGLTGGVSASQQTRERNDSGLEGCARYQIQFDDKEVARAEETLDVPRASVDRLRAQTGRGGIQVVGWNGDSYRIRACKAAAGATLSEAQGRLSMMRLQVNAGQVAVTAPDGDDWLVHYIVQAPAGSAVSLEAANGPLSLKEFSGTADMESRNGPISISRSSGRITARAINGPVSVTDSSGEITATTQNGPVSVNLPGRAWTAGSLNASTQNGPLNFDMPSTYESGVEVRMGRHAPFRCNTAACRESGARTWDDDGRRVVLGSGPTAVRLSTVNGPVTIGERE